MSPLLAILAQVGPFVTPGAQPVSPLPPELQERRAPESGPAGASPPDDLARCLAEANADPEQTVRFATKWLGKAQGEQRAQAGHCLGLALAGLERWEAAASAFLAARDALPGEAEAYRARLGAMAGNAALAGGTLQSALDALDAAHADAQAAGMTVLAGEISVDRARAQVALGREADAELALAEARAVLPQDGLTWLLSATLSRRMGKLEEAQRQIERAAELLPADPEIGLEAGRIAMLAGREDAARRSWQSVIDAQPDGRPAALARSYLQQMEGP